MKAATVQWLPRGPAIATVRSWHFFSKTCPTRNGGPFRVCRYWIVRVSIISGIIAFARKEKSTVNDESEDDDNDQAAAACFRSLAHALLPC
jgi:hypothetical protein